MIKDLGTGKIYDYLYWEGLGLNYPINEKGFVVARNDLSRFFDEKLARLGLNKKEIRDFKDYWVLRLSEKPYYKISFLERGEFDAIAPLTISPAKPQTLIRIMMTAQGLDEYVKTTEQELPLAPERNGFTAVEWGGTLLRED